MKNYLKSIYGDYSSERWVIVLVVSGVMSFLIYSTLLVSSNNPLAISILKILGITSIVTFILSSFVKYDTSHERYVGMMFGSILAPGFIFTLVMMHIIIGFQYALRVAFHIHSFLPKVISFVPNFISRLVAKKKSDRKLKVEAQTKLQSQPYRTAAESCQECNRPPP